MIETKYSSPVEFKLSDSSAAGSFSGYASTFNGQPDAYGDVIAPSAFSESLAAHAKNGTAPALLWAHQMSAPIGTWQSLVEDRHGLAVAGKLTLGTVRGAEARALMLDGALGLSIGYRIPSGGSSYQGQSRTLTKIDLIEISAVSVPANSSARIHGVKSIDGLRPGTIREFEAALREACGLSHREAKRVASVGWNALHRDESDELQDICALLKSAAADFHTN